VDHVPSGVLSTPSQSGSQASSAEPGRPAAPQAGWPDVAVLYRDHHADLVRLALLVLRYYLNLPVAEVAAMLGISQGSVKSATARGRDPGTAAACRVRPPRGGRGLVTRG
jgi:Sigma-70, region 4